MDSKDRAEVRELLLDIISGPLEKINGQYRLMSSQLANIEVQTTKTNGRVTELENKVAEIDKIVTLEIGEIKTAKAAVRSFRDSVRGNWSVALVGLGILVTITLGVINFVRNGNQLKGQEVLKTEQDVIRDEVKRIMQDDSTYMHSSQFQVLINTKPKNKS